MELTESQHDLLVAAIKGPKCKDTIQVMQLFSHAKTVVELISFIRNNCDTDDLRELMTGTA